MVKSKKYNKNLKKKNYKIKVNKNQNKTKKKKIRSKSLMNKKNRMLLGGQGGEQESKIFLITSKEGWNVYIKGGELFFKWGSEIKFLIPNILKSLIEPIIDESPTKDLIRVQTSGTDMRFHFLMQYIFNMELTGLSPEMRTLIDEEPELRNRVLFIAFTVYFPNNYKEFADLYKAFKRLSGQPGSQTGSSPARGGAMRKERQRIEPHPYAQVLPTEDGRKVAQKLGYDFKGYTDTTIAHKIYRDMDFRNTKTLAKTIVTIIDNNWCPENIFTSFILLCIDLYWDLNRNNLYREIYNLKPVPPATVYGPAVESEVTAYLMGYIQNCPRSDDLFSKSRFNWDPVFKFDDEILSIKCVQVLIIQLAEMNLTSSDTTNRVLLDYKECMQKVLQEISSNTLFRFVIYFVTNNFFTVYPVFKILGISDYGINYEEKLYEVAQDYIKSRQNEKTLTQRADSLNDLLPPSQFKAVHEPQTFGDIHTALNNNNIDTYCNRVAAAPAGPLSLLAPPEGSFSLSAPR